MLFVATEFLLDPAIYIDKLCGAGSMALQGCYNSKNRPATEDPLIIIEAIAIGNHAQNVFLLQLAHFPFPLLHSHASAQYIGFSRREASRHDGDL
jgi:hypothetical protein